MQQPHLHQRLRLERCCCTRSPHPALDLVHVRGPVGGDAGRDHERVNLDLYEQMLGLPQSSRRG